MNSVTIMGRLGRDPEVKTIGSGTTLCKLNVAVDRFKKGGEKETDWFSVNCWDKLADTCADHLSKGRQVVVEGRLQTRSWETDSGEKRYATDIVAHRVHFCAAPAGESARGGAGTHTEKNWKDNSDEELPF
jgi:single-strand DNA-binding protein